MRPHNGEKYGEWVVICSAPRRSLCRCKCGDERFVQNYHLTGGASRMCRLCRNKDRPYGGKNLGIPREVWRRLRVAVNDVILRCTDPDSKVWRHYGGRGISIFSEWLADRTKFVVYLASLPGHDDGSLWLDRIDNDRGYEPGNLRFVTVSVSNLNKRPRGMTVGSTRWRRIHG